MKNTCLLSEDSKNYLCCFYQTLDGMADQMRAIKAGLNQAESPQIVASVVRASEVH